MRNNAVSTRHLILGLLTQQPMSGYDIKRFMKDLGWLIGSPSFGSLYPALHALLEDEMVTVEVIVSSDKPSRKLYSITDKGRETIETWASKPVESNVPLKAFVMRLILSNNFSTTGLITNLQHRHTQVMEHRTGLEQALDGSDQSIDPGQRLAIDYGLAMAVAELDWLNNKLSELTKE